MTSLAKNIVLLALLAGAPWLAAEELPRATPESAGFSSDALARVTAALQKRVDDGDIAGAVAAVVRNGKLVYFEAVGFRELESRSEMPLDALFRMYSMTRPITSLAAMILHAEGKFELDDPIKKFLPEFEAQRVFADPSAPNMNETLAREGDITVEHLLLHTSGLGSRSSEIYRAQNVRSRSISLREMVSNAARVPLFEHPGTRWRYGISTTVLGRLIEVWSGKSLDAFLSERVLEPLGMTDTVFWADERRGRRLAAVYRPSPEGELRPHGIEDVPFTEKPALLEGGVGLLSTTMDFLRFSQMFLNGGELDGRRVISSDTVRLMTVNRVPDALMPIGFGRPMKGTGWTLGFSAVMDASDYAYPVTDGTFWWDGSAGTRFWIEPELDLITIVNAQVSPARGGGFREEFKTLVDAALVER